MIDICIVGIILIDNTYFIALLRNRSISCRFGSVDINWSTQLNLTQFILNLFFPPKEDESVVEDILQHRCCFDDDGLPPSTKL